MNGISALIKDRDPQPLPRREDTGRSLRPEEGPHLTMLTPDLKTPSLQNREQEISAVYKMPSLVL